MKPKYSTGYFTPQANKVKKNTRPRFSESHEDLTMMNMSDGFEKLMSCPIKRQLVLNLIASEVDIGKYKKEGKKNKDFNESPLSKVQRKHLCESPTALLRRRVLEQQDRQSPLSENQSDHNKSRSTSRQSSVSSSSPIPFDKLLDGVIAYVEIKSKDEKDRSKGAKALLQSMGAIVRDTFTKDVTHVIFKDGSFTTYQKAKLMKVHLVSVLWIEAVRSSNTKVSEKKFPALGTEAYDHNVSSLCSQMQRDYEDIIRDELRRSLAAGTPLPSTQSFIDRRRTIMTPISSTSRLFSQEFRSSQDREVEQIIQHGRKTNHFAESNIGSPLLSRISPAITDDDSDLAPFINGSITTRKKDTVIPFSFNSVENLGDYSTSSTDLTNTDSSSLKCTTTAARTSRKKSNAYKSDMDMTTLEGRLIVEGSSESSTKENNVSNISDNSIYYKKTPKLKSKRSLEKNFTPRRSTDDLFNVPDESIYRRRTRQLRNNINISADNSTNISNDKADNSSHSAMSSLRVSDQDGLQIFSKNTCSMNTDPLRILESLAAPTVQVSTEEPSKIAEKSSDTNMSSLHISSESSKENIVNKVAKKSSSTSMSALLISPDSIGENTKKRTLEQTESNNNFVNEDDKNKSKKVTPLKSSKNTPLHRTYSNLSGDNSFSPLNPNVLKEVLQVLDKSPLPDENVTKRRGRYSGNKSVTNVPRRKTIPSEEDSIKNSGGGRKSKKVLRAEPSPSKKLKTSSKSEQISARTPKKKDDDLEGSDNNKSKLGGRRQALNKKGESDFDSKKTKGSDTSISDTHSSSETSGSDRKGKKLRKLYNPDESIQDIVKSDEQEREDKRMKVKKPKSDEDAILKQNIITITPNILLTAKAKAFVDKNHIDVEAVLSKGSEDSDKDKTPAKTKKKNKEKQISVNSEDDEQQELTKEFINKKKNNELSKAAKKLGVRSEGKVVLRRQSIRLSQCPRKNFCFDSSTSSADESIPKNSQSVKMKRPPRKKLNLNSSTSKDKTNIIPISSVINRRSTMEFQTLSQMSAKKRLKIDKNKRPSIVCTKMHKDEIQIFNQIVRKLGGFVIEDEVSNKTTHLVAGEAKRTINMLRAIAMGCWVLKREWLLSSLEEGRWLPEEDFEQTDFSPAVQQCRLQRQAFGPTYSMDIFQHCEPIYIARGSIPRCSDLRELVGLCKGKVVTALRNAGIVVGERVRQENVKCVKETWILDSITFNKKMPLKKYIIPPRDDSQIV